MASKQQKEKNGKKTDQKPSSWERIKSDTKQDIIAVTFFVLFVIFTLSSFGKAGTAGDHIYSLLSTLLGIGYFLIPLFFLMLSVSFFKAEEKEFNRLKVFGGLLFFVSGLGLIDLVSKTYWTAKGGELGWLISTPLGNLFGFYASMIILLALIVIACLIVFETKLTMESILFWKKFKKEEREDEIKDLKITDNKNEILPQTKQIEEEKTEEKKKDKTKVILGKKNGEEEELKFSKYPVISANYVPPPLSLLEDDKGRVVSGDVKANANIIKRTLQNFGIDVEMDEVSIGPSVTRYALKPAEGVRLSKIISLASNLELALAAHPVRIEAPIPGKSLVGIEIPNSVKSTVGLALLIGSEEFQKSDKSLLVTLGKSISGKSHFADLAKMPHALIAGATGSGKSVTIHTMITSLLYRNSPENLKFIMIDPKRVELTLYNKIPHLLTPVITDAKKAIIALKWAAKEMDRRYDILESKSVKDIDSYHKNILAPAVKKMEELKKSGKYSPEKDAVPEPMPFIIIVIDELADIMASYPRELEAGIIRLAQMSRAVGIHLILSTQRPEVRIITGIIKANIPTRIALQVVSQVDSRTILDTMGAEKLLGAGDMLYLGGEMSKPIRIQSAFISEKEVKDIVKYLVNSYKNELIGGEIDLGEVSGNEISDVAGGMFDNNNLEDDDELYAEAKEEVLKAGKASTSYLQRKLRVGYARAARLIDLLEERGIVGPGDGAKPREVIDTETEIESKIDPVAKKQLDEMRNDGDFL